MAQQASPLLLGTEKISTLLLRYAIPAIIAMTADAFSEDIKNCLDCGMNAHTAKPINLDEVLSLIKRNIRKDD